MGHRQERPMAPSPLHLGLTQAARQLPRGVARRGLIWLYRLLVPAAMSFVRDGGRRERVPGGQSVVLYRPEGAGPRPAVLWMHGGGLLFGAAKQESAFCLQMKERLGVTVASVEYRPGPNSPYPAALNDCMAALAWLAEQPDVDPQRIIVGGNSAGAGLAAAVCLRALREGLISPAFQLLVYPMLDDRTTGEGMDPDLFRIWDPASNALGWSTYLRGLDEVPDLAAPARCSDLSGLPPTWIGVGDRDLFHDEDVAYAARLTEAGVPCTLEVVPGAFHGFDAVASQAAVSRSFRESQLVAVSEALGIPLSAA